MSERKWTADQKNAISSRNGTVLVSAAAGSGKTAVLVQRVIEMLTDVDNPCDADRLLVVTFTNAAASEMRERISAKISQMLTENPFNANLQRQQLLMSNSHISTIHSFCNTLVRDKFYKLDISPDFRICDSNEILILKAQAIKEVLEQKYAQKEPAFFSFVEAFSSSRDDSKIESTVNMLYEFIRSHPFPEKWLNNRLDMYADVPPEKTVWGQTLINYALGAVNHCINVTKSSLALIDNDEKISEAYTPGLSADLSLLLSLKETCETGVWNDISNALHLFKFCTLKRLTGYSDDPLKNAVGANRQDVKDIIKKLLSLFFIKSDSCREDILLTRPIVSELFDIVKLFSEKFDSLKREKKVVDFGDLEHLTLKLLVRPTESGFERTYDAVEISKSFEQIIVDEYQDTNEAQDMIFKALSANETNLFMVGDVKQSIYGFRQAMPEIFLRKKNKFDHFDPEKNNYPAKIILGKNFRSRKGILGNTNFIFKRLMSKSIGDMEYTGDEELICGASYFESASPDFSIDIIDIGESAEKDMDILEARHIAKIISDMVSSGFEIQDGTGKRPIMYKDFCILLRNANKHAGKFVSELEKFSIPAYSDTPGKFIETPEIATMISLLRIIDNPVQDIPMLSAMLSPMFGFTTEEISEIRLSDKTVPIYFAVKKCSENGNEKCKLFIEQIEKFRALAVTLPSDKLIGYIYEKTGCLSMVQAMKNGQVRLNNLHLFCEYARNYEASGYKGIFAFVRLIDKIVSHGSDMISSCSFAENADVVKIMSIHRSKGLEFPVCIVANCSRKFNKELDSVVLHPRLGPGINLRDKKMQRQYSTFQRDAVCIDINRSNMSEELRVLYVAMTRAKEKLIMVSTLKGTESAVTALSAKITGSGKISPYVVGSSACFSDWLLLCALLHPSGKNLREIACFLPGVTLQDNYAWQINLINAGDIADAENFLQKKKVVIPNDDIIKLIDEKINLKYPFEQLCKLKTKVSVSELVCMDNDKVLESFDFSKKPDFAHHKKMSAADVGTAMHAFLQFANFKKAKENINSQINLLLEKGFLSQEQAKSLNINLLNQFLNSDLMGRILKSDNVIREYRFTVNVPAHFINPDLNEPLKSQNVVLQGAIDCIFEENGILNIIDYKTNKINSIAELYEYYEKQLNLYRFALSKCTNKPVNQCILYSLSTGDFISF